MRAGKLARNALKDEAKDEAEDTASASVGNASKGDKCEADMAAL